MKKPILALALLTGVLLLQGCAAVVVGGAAGTAKASGDRRTLGAQWDDQTIELKAANLLADNKPWAFHSPRFICGGRKIPSQPPQSFTGSSVDHRLDQALPAAQRAAVPTHLFA